MSNVCHECGKVWSPDQTVTFKLNTFLLVNVNLHDQLKLEKNLRGELFRIHVKLTIAQIAIENDPWVFS